MNCIHSRHNLLENLAVKFRLDLRYYRLCNCNHEILEMESRKLKGLGCSIKSVINKKTIDEDSF